MELIDFLPFNGNPNLKKSNQPFEWTPELVQEYLKCSEDPIYFAETYMKIVNVDMGLIPIKLYDYQRDMILSMHENRNSIFATARQAGKTTSVTAYLLWYIIFNKNKTVALLANKGDTAREILSRIQMAYQHLPKWLQHGVLEWNKGSFVLENGSRILAAATSTDAIRGYSINFLFIDEAAHIENWDEFFASVYPTISSGKTTKVTLVSTPNGLNHFWKTWDAAVKGENDYHAIEIPWWKVPGRDEAWKQKTLADMNFDTEKFAQEHEVQFLGSSGTLIAGWKLKELKEQIPIRSNNGIYQYKKPEKDRNYAIVVDVSRGRGLDYSAAQVIDITDMPYEQVCVFRDNLITPVDYADVIHQLGKLYNNATVLIETNDIGGQIADLLYYDYEYVGLVHTANAGPQGKRISQGFSGRTELGIRTTLKVKNVGCSILKMLIEQNQLILHDKFTIDELKTFSRKNKTYEAEPGNHDDLTMCLVLFAWMSDQPFFKEITDINTLMRLREKSDEEIMEDMLPFGFIDDGRHEYIDDIIDEYDPQPMTVFFE